MVCILYCLLIIASLRLIMIVCGSSGCLSRLNEEANVFTDSFFLSIFFSQDIKKDPNDAERMFRKALEIDPTHPRSMLALATILQQQNRYVVMQMLFVACDLLLVFYDLLSGRCLK
jgi:Tfp pilus assembly protein PilF